MPSVVIIGTGGTIAGTATRTADSLSYTAGTLRPEQLVAAVPALAAHTIETVALAQLDSKDMEPAIWQALAHECARQLARAEVAGVVVTHGTDTLEETAYFLHRTVRADKPLVLTAAMRPATAPSADGPQNLLDAVHVAQLAGAQGVLAVLAGRVHAGADLRKMHSWVVDAFGSGDAGPVALVQGEAVRLLRQWPASRLHRADIHATEVSKWPLVEIVTSHAGARGETLTALVDAGAAGIVISGTGNGSVHRALLAAASVARGRGVAVLRASRCLLGGVVDARLADQETIPSAGTLTPYQARIELMLDLLAGPS